MAEAWSNLPKVTTEHGLVEFLPEEFAGEKILYTIGVDPLPLARDNRDHYGWWDIWGDGSSKPPADPKLCRSEVGVCDGDWLVHCEHLQGPRQTNPHAGLTAMLRAASLGNKTKYHGDYLAGVVMAEARRLHGVAWPPVELMASGDIWKQWDTIEAARDRNEKTIVLNKITTRQLSEATTRTRSMTTTGMRKQMALRTRGESCTEVQSLCEGNWRSETRGFRKLGKYL